MLIKTVVDDAFEVEKIYKSSCRARDTEEYNDIELSVAQIDYNDAFAENLSLEISKYYIHSIYKHDYESSSDAGDGRDDYFTEEEDKQITLSECIIKDNKFFGVLCESFGCQSFVLVEYPETIISHPNNYGGKNYHFYRTKRFTLNKK